MPEPSTGSPVVTTASRGVCRDAQGMQTPSKAEVGIRRLDDGHYEVLSGCRDGTRARPK